MKLTKEQIDALHYSVLDDSTKIIMYLEEKDDRERRNRWKRLLINIASWLGGILTSLLVQYLIKIFALS